MSAKKTWIYLALIVLIGLIFRSHQLIERFGFAHDGDLYSWIVKDIVIDKHFRLVGQLTSVNGIFIGPLFYYLLVPFFLVFNLDPIGSAYFTLVISIATILSYFFILSKLFNKTVGLIAAFLHASVWSTIGFDRWMVPTITTKLWAIWYLYTLILLSRGQFGVLPLLGILIGLIWHVHLALLPTLLAVPIAILLSKKLPTLKQLLLTLISLTVTSIPLILFEAKHNFVQFNSLISSLFNGGDGKVDLYKLQIVLGKISENTTSFLLSPLSLPQEYKLPLTVATLFSVVWLVKIHLINTKEIVVLLFWIFGVIIYFTFSSILSSEYYFANLEIIFMLIVSLLLFAVFRSSVILKYLVILLLGFLLIRNLFLYLTIEPYHVGYAERKKVAEYITRDSKEKSFPCVAINYITLPGENVGFRYFFYINNLKLAPPSDKVPVYSIVFPYEWSKNEVKAVFGHMGVIPPAKIPPKKDLEYDCSGQNTNLTDPMFGYVE